MVAYGNFPATDGTPSAARVTGPRVHHQVPNAGHNLPKKYPPCSRGPFSRCPNSQRRPHADRQASHRTPRQTLPDPGMVSMVCVFPLPGAGRDRGGDEQDADGCDRCDDSGHSDPPHSEGQKQDEGHTA